MDRLRRLAITRAEDTIEFLNKALEAANAEIIPERLDGEGRLDEAQHLLDPNLGPDADRRAEQARQHPVIVNDLVRDLDSIAKQFAYSGWEESQPGDRAARLEMRTVLKTYALPVTAPLFDNAYAYIWENY